MKIINLLKSHIKKIFFLKKMQNSFLSYKSDRYNGVIVDEKELPNDPILFEKLLKASLEHWISEKKRGIWLKIPVHLSFLITAGINEGI